MEKLMEIFNGISEKWEFDSAKSTDGKKMFWKEVAKTGTYRDVHGKLVNITPDYFDELCKNFNPGEDIPVPRGHAGKRDPAMNTGYVRQLERRGESLWALLEITEPDIAAKIERETIKHDSIGVRMEEGIGRVLDHVALTLAPAIPDLSGFQGAFEGFAVNVFEFSAPGDKEESILCDGVEKIVGVLITRFKNLN